MAGLLVMSTLLRAIQPYLGPLERYFKLEDEEAASDGLITSPKLLLQRLRQKGGTKAIPTLWLCVH
jgi:hypothetical protein